MSWRGQGGGKRAKGRRGDQDPELDNTAWLAELEREAVAKGDDDEGEDDWATTLRGRRPPVPPTPPPGPPDPGWAPPDPAPSPPSDYRHLGMEPGGAEPAYGSGAWTSDPAPLEPLPGPREPLPGPRDPIPASPDPIFDPRDPMPDPLDPLPGPRDPMPDPDWSWRQPGPDPFGEPGPAASPDPGPAGREGFGDPGPAAYPDPAPEPFGEPGQDAGSGADWGGPADDPGDRAWRSAGVDTPTGTWSPVEPVGREPDYPALFGELYRRSAAQQDPIWEDPPDHPLPEQGQPDPPSSAWPFEETTQSWEPSDRSFIWPPGELPSTPAEWDQPTPRSWLDDPDSQPPTPSSVHTPAPAPPYPDPYPSPEPGQPRAGNGVPPTGPPPADWAAAIPTDVPAARRAADPGATRMWRPDEAEPGVPLGEARAPEAPPGRGARARAAGSRAARADALPADEPTEVRRGAPAKAAAKARRTRPAAGERQAKAWPRIVAVISWIVLVMVVCWFYVFPWLERVLPENF